MKKVALIDRARWFINNYPADINLADNPPVDERWFMLYGSLGIFGVEKYNTRTNTFPPLLSLRHY